MKRGNDKPYTYAKRRMTDDISPAYMTRKVYERLVKEQKRIKKTGNFVTMNYQSFHFLNSTFIVLHVDT